MMVLTSSLTATWRSSFCLSWWTVPGKGSVNATLLCWQMRTLWTGMKITLLPWARSILKVRQLLPQVLHAPSHLAAREGPTVQTAAFLQEGRLAHGVLFCAFLLNWLLLQAGYLSCYSFVLTSCSGNGEHSLHLFHIFTASAFFWCLNTFLLLHPSPPLYPYCNVYGYTATKEPELILLMRTDMWAVSGNQTCFFDAPTAEYVKNREKVSPVDSHCCLFLQSFTAPSCTDSSSTLRTEMLQKLCWRSGAWRTFALALKVKLSPPQGKC